MPVMQPNLLPISTNPLNNLLHTFSLKLAAIEVINPISQHPAWHPLLTSTSWPTNRRQLGQFTQG